MAIFEDGKRKAFPPMEPDKPKEPIPPITLTFRTPEEVDIIITDIRHRANLMVDESTRDDLPALVAKACTDEAEKRIEIVAHMVRQLNGYWRG